MTFPDVPTPVPVPPLVSGEELLVAAALPTPDPPVVTEVSTDDRVAEIYGAFDPWAATIPSGTRAAMALAAVQAIDNLAVRAAKRLHPSTSDGDGWDGYEPGPDLEVADDHTVTDPHALWSTYDHKPEVKS